MGAGPLQPFCTGGTLPAGYAATATDCAPDDATRWQTLGYAQVDRDGDGFTAPESAAVCTGAALPDPYRASANGNDCADDDRQRWRWVVLYRDGDGDGVGAPPRTVQCLGASQPPGFSQSGWDVDDADRTVQVDPADDTDLMLILL